MAWHEFIITEVLPPCSIAFFKTKYPKEDKTNELDIGPLFPLFFECLQKTYAKETGKPISETAANLWMGPARYHLPPTTRWICKIELANGELLRDTIEVWMAVNDRVVLDGYANVKNWAGGTFASVESTFDTSIDDSLKGLRRLLDHHELTAIGKTVFVENFQATNHGGWDRYRVMIEIDKGK